MKLRNKKTGEIGNFMLGAISDHINLYRRGYSTETENVWRYNSLSELKEEWEDYEPTKPLIENKEIREIVRAWADINDAGKLKYNFDENSLNDIYRNTITFNRGLSLKDGHSYTISELCGEEEE